MTNISNKDQVHKAAVSFLAAKDFDSLPEKHSECLVLQNTGDEIMVLSPDQYPFWRKDVVDTDEYRQQQEQDRETTTMDDILIHNSWILPTCATVEFEVSSCQITIGYMTLLFLKHSKTWIVISVVLETFQVMSSSPSSFSEECNSAKSRTTGLNDFLGPLKACWEDYMRANRACDGDSMAKVFCPQVARLTFSSSSSNDDDDDNDHDTVIIKPSLEFCQMVTNRYTTESMHIPYAEFCRNNPVAVASGDTLQGISMISPNLALVRLKVGHPPCLWSDLLVCAKVQERWWIVAKSSSTEPFYVSQFTTEKSSE